MPSAAYLRAVRKEAVSEREEWDRILKRIRGNDFAVEARGWVRVWKRREKAATMIIRREEGYGPSDIYGWPDELASDMTWVIDRAMILDLLPGERVP